MYSKNQKVVITNGCYSGLVGIILRVSKLGFYLVKPIEECLPEKNFTANEIKPYAEETL